MEAAVAEGEGETVGKGGGLSRRPHYGAHQFLGRRGDGFLSGACFAGLQLIMVEFVMTGTCVGSLF